MCHLVGHVFEGAVDVGAFAQVFDLTEIPDEALSCCKLTEDLLLLREVQAPKGPSDLDLAPVLSVFEFLDEYPHELFDALHQTAGWRLLQGDGL